MIDFRVTSMGHSEFTTFPAYCWLAGFLLGDHEAFVALLQSPGRCSNNFYYGSNVYILFQLKHIKILLQFELMCQNLYRKIVVI